MGFIQISCSIIQMDMTKAPEQLMEHRVQKAFAISIGQGAYRSRSLTSLMGDPPCSNETTKRQQTEKG